MTLEAPPQPTCPARILVVEDDPSIALGLKLNLGAEGYDVGVADDGSLGLERITSERWDVVILDVMLPKLNGYEVVTRMRQGGDETPVLMLSAKSAEADKVMGLELGAEDYITKPFGIGELLARIKVALRRRPKAPPPLRPPGPAPTPETAAPEEPREGALYRFADVEVDTRTREVRRAGQPVDMTVTEFDILETLVRSGGSVMSRRAIFERVWGPNHHGTPRTIDNFVAQLRQKLEPDAERAKHIVTVRGIGYRFGADPKR
jgi:two-component system, OmpR family, alkaline phosphatase synthesis response regulator PhoP